MKDIDAYIWLNSINGVGYRTIEKLLNKFKNPLNIWNASEKDIREIPSINKKIIDNIILTRKKEYIINLKKTLTKYKIQCITREDVLYPKILKNIYSPPHILYIRGNFNNSFDKTIAIVGSRKATAFGKKTAYKFAYELTQNGFTIISGMASGIDTAAHKGALDAGGKTIAILGCGVDICYPKSNYDLMNRIIENGAIVSEFSVGTAPKAGNFPQRNRIISGLSKGILVVEASLKSGSLITVNFALDQGKDIYAIPGNINNSSSKGTNKLIKEGAKLVTSIDDILEDFDMENTILGNNDNNINNDLNEIENKVYKIVESKQPISIDYLFTMLDIDIAKMNSILTLLELKGYIDTLPGNILIAK